MTVDQLRSTGDAFTNITNVRRFNGFNGFLIITVGVSLMYFTYFPNKCNVLRLEYISRRDGIQESYNFISKIRDSISE